MKQFLFVFLILFSLNTFAQNLPEFNIPATDTVIVNSFQSNIIIQNISDGDSMKQQLTFEVNSSNVSILAVDSVSYNQGDKMAVIWVSGIGVLGAVDISISITDEDGTSQKTFKVVVSNYSHNGIKFEIHDAVFWQEVIPLDATPVFDSLIQSTNMKVAYDNLDWDKIDLTVSAGCSNTSLCDGHDFSTGFLKGFLIPENSGDYTFYINGDSDYALFLSTDETFENAIVIAANSDKYGKIGSVSNGRKSEPVNLFAGKVYAIYAAQWNIHNENGGVQWELPGEITRSYIPADYLYPDWDTQNPERVTGIWVTSRGDNFLRIDWNESSDNQKLLGYNVYVNGIKVNGQVVNDNHFLIENLDFETNYSITVTAVDLVKNESFITEIVNAKTYSEDTIAPTPPTNLDVDVATGLAIQISWNGATDDKTGISGYNVYLNGELYNTNELILDSSVIIKVLEPETEYEIQIEALDAGMNVSPKSQIFKVSTIAFNPLGENLGLKTGKLEFSTEAISFNEGLGINPNFKNGEVFNPAHTEMLNDLKPGAIRWGALTANPLSFKDYVGSGKNVTVGKFFTRCNDLDAYTVFCCGVENNTDWIKNDETFIHFLEYVNGPDETIGGKIRVSEGYTEPFLKNSKGLIFEFGNEVWGGVTHNAQIGENYNNYALWCRQIATKMRASEFYDSSKIVLVYSARNPSREASYGLNDKIIDGDKGEVDWIGPSGYIGGNLDYDPAFPPAKSELDYYNNVRLRADSYLSGIATSHKFEVEKTGRIFKQYMYESNTSTPTYNSRLGQALFCIDYYLTAMELGSAIPTIFHLTGGEWRITEPEKNYRRLPLFLTAKYFNEYCKGDVLYDQYFPNQGSVSGPGATFGNRPVGCHSYRNNNGYSVVFISRDYENDHYVQIDLPDDFEFNTPGKLVSITGEDFNTKNVKVDSMDIAIADEMIVKVPKHGMIFIRIGSDSLNMANLPLAHYNYPKMQRLSIYAPKNTFTGPNEKLSFRAYIEPGISWDKELVWTLINNSGNYSINTQATFCFVHSGHFVGNETDSLILRVSNRVGDVFDEVVIYLPETPVSSEDLNRKSEFRFYPNPANNKISVEVETGDTLKIFSIEGKKVLENELVNGRNEIDINHLPNGLYTLNFKSESRNLLINN